MTDYNEDSSRKKLALLIALFIVASFFALWIHEYLENPKERHTQHLQSKIIYTLTYDDSCSDASSKVELCILGIHEDMEFMNTSIRYQLTDRSGMRDTVVTYIYIHSGGTLPIQTYYCGQYRTVGVIWNAHSLLDRVVVRMEKGFQWRVRQVERKF